MSLRFDYLTDTGELQQRVRDNLSASWATPSTYGEPWDPSIANTQAMARVAEVLQNQNYFDKNGYRDESTHVSAPNHFYLRNKVDFAKFFTEVVLIVSQMPCWGDRALLSVQRKLRQLLNTKYGMRVLIESALIVYNAWHAPRGPHIDANVELAYILAFSFDMLVTDWPNAEDVEWWDAAGKFCEYRIGQNNQLLHSPWHERSHSRHVSLGGDGVMLDTFALLGLCCFEEKHVWRAKSALYAEEFCGSPNYYALRCQISDDHGFPHMLEIGRFRLERFGPILGFWFCATPIYYYVQFQEFAYLSGGQSTLGSKADYSSTKEALRNVQSALDELASEDHINNYAYKTICDSILVVFNTLE